MANTENNLSLKEIVEGALETQDAASSDGFWEAISRRSLSNDVQSAWQVRSIARPLAILCDRRIVRNSPGQPFEVAGLASVPKDCAPSTKDKTVLLRNLLRLLGDGVQLRLPKTLSDEIAGYAHASSVRLRDDLSGVTYANSGPLVIEADSEGIASIFDPKPVLRRTPTSGSSDALMKRWTRYPSYQSEYQREAVRQILSSPPRAVVLVTLPTGAGKSICYQLPALQWTRAGENRGGGTTIVIVPTVALAEDQQAIAKEMFEPNSACVTAVTADTPEGKRQGVFTEIASGQQALVFMSPELALGAGRSAIQEAADNHKLKMLVVDEVHLLETWGVKFRPAIQKIAEFRRQLSSANEELRTVLLSATVSHGAPERIYGLYANQGDPFTHIDGSALRTEHDYFTRSCGTEAKRDALLSHVVDHLPRPIIVYSTLVRDAERHFATLHDAGYRRVACFTGQTQSDERQRIIGEWRRDEIDIVCATSAFGLGVDKPDVRSILHLTMPENLDRFYQEIGRGGRDGFPCSSILFTAGNDRRVAHRNALSNLITSKLAAQRWMALRDNGENTNLEGRVVWKVNLDTQPPHVAQQTVASGRTNREWNEGTLLLMERAGLLKSWEFSDDTETAYLELIKAETCLGSSETIRESLELPRKTEQDRNRKGLERIAEWIDPKRKSCVTEEICRQYEIDFQGNCGRCDYCRDRSYGGRELEGQFEINRIRTSGTWMTESRPLSDRLQYVLRPFPFGFFEYDAGQFNQSRIAGEFGLICQKLADEGVDQFIVPSELAPKFAELLSQEFGSFGFILTRDQVVQEMVPNLGALSTLVPIIPPDHDDPGLVSFLDVIQNMENYFSFHRPCIFLAPRGFRLRSMMDRTFASMISTKRYVNAKKYLTSL